MIVDYNAFLSYGIILLIGMLTNYQITSSTITYVEHEGKKTPGRLVVKEVMWNRGGNEGKRLSTRK